QLFVLKLLKTGLEMNYLGATFVAVEIAVLHNFIWHERWTWLETTRSNAEGAVGRLFRFHLTNGLISIVGNLLLIWIFVSKFHIYYSLATLIAIATCSILNFVASDRLVLRREHSRGISR